MYVVLTEHKSREAMIDLIAALLVEFPSEKFTYEGSEEKGYKARIEGAGDEKLPRKFAIKFLKAWKPKPVENIIVQPVLPKKEPSAEVVKPVYKNKINVEDILKSVLPK